MDSGSLRRLFWLASKISRSWRPSRQPVAASTIWFDLSDSFWSLGKAAKALRSILENRFEFRSMYLIESSFRNDSELGPILWISFGRNLREKTLKG
jgi:hypothetical protein